jgi:hypothetical protein
MVMAPLTPDDEPLVALVKALLAARAGPPVTTFPQRREPSKPGIEMTATERFLRSIGRINTPRLVP